MADQLRVLMITSEWPSRELPTAVPFLVNQVSFLRSHGLKVDVLNFRGAKNPLNYLRAWLRVRRQLSAKRYDLIHAQFGQSAILAFPREAPLVVTFHGSDLQGTIGESGRQTLSGASVKALSKMIAPFADEIILVSEHMAPFVGARFHHVIPCGVDLELFRPAPMKTARAKLGLPSDRLLVLFGGNPNVPCKRLGLAEKVVSLVQQRLEVDLIVTVGIRHDVMPDYMNACDAMLVTSSQEGSPTVVKEALACNLPVVSVDVADVGKWIGGLAGCALCKDERPENLAQSLDSVLRQGRRIEGRQAVLDLDERLLTLQIIAVYKQALSRLQSRRVPHARLSQANLD